MRKMIHEMTRKDIYDEIEEQGSLLRKYFNGELDPVERKRLADWLRCDRKNRELLHRLRDERLLHGRYARYQKIDAAREFGLLVKRYPGLRERKRISWRYYAAASVVAIFLVAGGLWFSWREERPVKVALKASIPEVQAVLRTADGEVISISADTRFGGNDSFSVKDSLKELVYTGDTVAREVVRYHQLEVPRGGEYKLVLADGTVVQLNSESSIRFPEFFTGKTREVVISGNVYLQVAKDAVHPFVVRAGEFVTRVLGTHFAVRAYPDETEWMTTLEEGCVEVAYREKRVVLKPGQQAYVDQASLKTREVDLGKELSWTKGVFVFEHERLEHVVKELSRWYDIKFEFGDDRLKDYIFTGSVERDIGVENVLTLIEHMNVIRFEKKEGRYLIKTNDKVRK